MNLESKKQITVLPLLILILVVFFLQTGIKELVKFLELEGNFLKLMVIIQLVVSIFLPIVLYLKVLKLPAKDTLGLYPPHWINAIIAVILGFITIIAIGMVLPRIIPPSQELVETSRFIVSYGNLPEFLLSFITVAIFASVVDELFFRGVLLRGLMQRYGKFMAIAVTAILTSFLHTWEPFKLVHAFLMGIIFAISAVWTNSIYTSIILHSLYNSLSLLPQG